MGIAGNESIQTRLDVRRRVLRPEEMSDDRYTRPRNLGDAAIESAWESADVRDLTALVIDISRDLARSVPPPRGAPFFGLDIEAEYDPAVLEAFWARGIFRKYEFALDMGSGLGGRARWLAAHSGCRILGIDPCPSRVAAAAALNRRAHLEQQVTFQAGRLDTLPLRGRLFTHVWMVDPGHDGALQPACAEGFRVLRPGGHFALQRPRASAAERAELLAVLRGIGFMEIDVREVTFSELPAVCRLARDRWRASIARQCGKRAGEARAAAALGEQIFGRRPA